MGYKLPLVSTNFLLTPFNKHEAGDFEAFWKEKVDFIAFQNLIDINYDKDKGQLIDEMNDFRCNMPNFRVTIKADGSVKPCCTFYGDKLYFGNIFQSKLREIINDIRWIEFQDMHEKFLWRKHSVCRKCIMHTVFDM